jgi:hypothetical protein
MKQINILVVALVFAFSVGPATAQQDPTRAQSQCIATRCELPEVCLRRVRDRAYEQSDTGRIPSDMSLLRGCMLEIELCARRTCDFRPDELFTFQPPTQLD